MRIFIITRGYPTDNYPGNGIFEYDQAKALTAAGHEVVYLAVDLRSLRRKRKWGFESLERDGISIEAINLPLGRVPKSLLQTAGRQSLKRLYQRAITKFGVPDIVHSHFISSGFLAMKVIGGQGIPLIHTEHYSGMHSSNLSTAYWKLGEQTYKAMDKVIAVSQSLAISIRENFEVDVSVIPNIVDVDTFLQVEPKKLGSDNKVRFVSVGNLKPIKRMDLLIESFGEAFRDDKNVSLFIYGDGPERKKLTTLIDQLSMQNQIHLMGYAKREVIAQKMFKSDCFVLVSDSETFGVAYIEAMAAGLPVIATRCGGPEDFVDESNGILIEKNNTEEIAQALIYLRDNSQNYDRASIASNIEAQYSPRVIGQSLVELYSSLVSGNADDDLGSTMP